MGRLLLVLALLVVTGCSSVASSSVPTEEVVIVNWSWRIENQRLIAVGEMRNQGKRSLIPTLEITARNAQGQVLDTNAWSSVLEPIPPGESRPWSYDLYNVREQPAEVTARIRSVRT